MERGHDTAGRTLQLLDGPSPEGRVSEKLDDESEGGGDAKHVLFSTATNKSRRMLKTGINIKS